MSTVMIVGATRGIGLEMVRQYAADGDIVIACARDTGAATLLDEVAAGIESVTIEQLDIADPASIDAAAERIGDGAIDKVVIVAGVAGGNQQTLDDLDIEAWHDTLNANTIGPALVARAFKRNLIASGNGSLMIISSQVGASTWPLGGMYIYSTTKAAVNRVGKILSIDWKDEPITVSIMHPGWVQTDMGGAQAELTVEESASGIRTVLSGLTKKDSGNFYKWNGELHAW
ncbi:MAG: SDR family oxidoreductase [Gammaproteobacteria bacterium]|jgi:NAD(P)-dependent dehydrogenase (short-subunit alcohol dehydrogenase family)|nr:SDR family oxidoreductase [Gammaproteobacteria bacterium]MBT4494694.1 SDR family oxidoreductase [Gammaproteobacteria bacterium]MBT7372304.1 SDR family oxidoreductase [Gammaproteobacteria bacterium]